MGKPWMKLFFLLRVSQYRLSYKKPIIPPWLYPTSPHFWCLETQKLTDPRYEANPQGSVTSLCQDTKSSGCPLALSKDYSPAAALPLKEPGRSLLGL